jgi:hypothetical protein
MPGIDDALSPSGLLDGVGNIQFDVQGSDVALTSSVQNLNTSVTHLKIELIQQLPDVLPRRHPGAVSAARDTALRGYGDDSHHFWERGRRDERRTFEERKPGVDTLPSPVLAASWERLMRHSAVFEAIGA